MQSKGERQIKDPEIKVGQIWDALSEEDFGTGNIKYSIVTKYRNPKTQTWICQVNQYQLDAHLDIGGNMPVLELTVEDFKDNYQYLRDHVPPQVITTQPNWRGLRDGINDFGGMRIGGDNPQWDQQFRYADENVRWVTSTGPNADGGFDTAENPPPPYNPDNHIYGNTSQSVGEANNFSSSTNTFQFSPQTTQSGTSFFLVNVDGNTQNQEAEVTQ